MADRFEISQYDDGQIYVTENGQQMLHAKIRGPHDVEVQVGGHGGAVAIDKLYGPLIFWPIRVTLDLDACEWVIERHYGPEGEWLEAARIPGQLDSDFTDNSADNKDRA